jgi:hypothetical protein
VFLKKNLRFFFKTRSPQWILFRPIFERSEKEGVNRVKSNLYSNIVRSMPTAYIKHGALKKSLPKWQLFSRGTRFEGVDLNVLNKINRIHKKAYVL